MGKLEGRVAIVTGGGRGIGRATALLFASEGARVMVATRTAEPGQETVDAIVAKGGEAALSVLDMGERSAVKAMVEETARHFGRIDIVLHNAAYLAPSFLAEMPDEVLDKMIDVGLKACFWLTKDALPWLEKSPAARILVTSSVAGNRISLPGRTHYGATKTGVTGFVRGAALELAHLGITVNAVEPGTTRTHALMTVATDSQIDAMTADHPIARAADPAEMAAAFLYFASDEAGYATGQTLCIDGGATLGNPRRRPEMRDGD